MTRTALLVALALAAVALFFLFMRGGESEPAADVVAAVEGGATVVDVRTEGEYAAGHLVGARHANVLAGDFR